MPYNADKIEKEILNHWDKTDAFKKSVDQRPKDNPYVFYDGPPFATGLPHYGHFPSSIMKDAIPRYQTMRGKRVERVWGWDCHGLPIENIVEKELQIKSKKEIEEMGIEKFNELCRSKVLGYVDEWEKTITRLGRWVDMKHAYRTMDRDYMESIWWAFKQLWDKKLIYKGYRSMHVCPRCETTLSQQEVSEGYEDIKDLTATVKFKVTNAKKILDIEGDVLILAWTTTPWTLPGNVLLAVGEDIEYTVLIHEGAHYVVAKELLMRNFEGKEFEVIDQLRGKDLIGLTYEPLFPYFADTKNAFHVVAADFVTVGDGTGIVHIAPAFGDDDFYLGKREDVGWVQHVSMNGIFTDEVTDFVGQVVKPKGDEMATDITIIKWLAHHERLFAKEKITHSYPHCWRCDTPLLNYATTSWFVNVLAVKEQALEQAQKIHWSPGHVKEGRFGKWLEGARDWSISRQRFWASVMPVWECENVTDDEQGCDYIAVGSIEELKQLSGQEVDDLHKHIIDKITFPCPGCGKTMKRIPDVLDTWFDSGSMPYAQLHYPFEHKEKFEAGFPADFIAEGQDQTRAWFYYLHILATSLHGTPAFQHVIVNGIVVAEDGKKMSKKLKNYPDPNMMLEKYGADAMRYFMLTSPIVAAENLNFSETGVREMYNKVVNTLWNVLAFFDMFKIDSTDEKKDSTDSTNILDKWILSKLQMLLRDVTDNMEAYKLNEASRPIMEFISELSQWYVRRSRDRFKGTDEQDKAYALGTLRHVLMTLSKVMAPFTPFIAEKIYQALEGELESVHLERWPEVSGTRNEEHGTILKDMEVARKIVELGLSARAEAGLKVRQPLQYVRYQIEKLSEDLEQIIAQELNVKEVKHTESVQEQNDRVVKEDGEIRVGLNTEITHDLKKEGLLREVVRTINQMRKEQGLSREHQVRVSYRTDDELLKSVFVDFDEELKRLVLAKGIEEGEGEEKKVDGRVVYLMVTKV